MVSKNLLKTVIYRIFIVVMKIKQIAVMSLAVLSVVCGMTFAARPALALECGEGVDTSIIGGDICKGVNNDSGKLEDNAIWKIMILVLNIMTAGVGIAAVGGIVYGAILYTSAADNSNQTKKAVGIIGNVAVGLVLYAMMYLLLNFLIPGGIFAG